MHKPFSIALALLSTVAMGANSIPVKDNSDIALTLSQGNYNRLVVKNDKIMEAVFPPNAMAIKRDEQDGSVYVMLAAANPFTLFLTTESGRHFSVTVNGEESLGKTIELVPVLPVVAASKTHAPKTNPKKITQEAIPEAIIAMLTHMEQQKPFADVKVRRQFSRAEQWSKGLTLLPKESWDSKLLKGETIELYNGGKEPLELAQDWFAKEGTLAIKFSKPSIKPGERAMLYRVEASHHG
ncbi:TPA: type-F conjugative transfer system secretin TraK [Legionella pneumophila]|uniref:type-F conjugative transfer system secretin TraK n=1 Tax=Legionella pneumophila TaxID=446 RepID=UPI0013750F64|nr:type-F conjugative transfer system secretin TraK [Legionella pneumophila]HCC3258011.1 type-F conjugative transfer system secretin TraK [Legionella pneumophila subsp. pneumophila]UAK70101.1 type-F conjugative transfer system secretin TraK [Legionella pneumophila]HAT1812539.1 type-F conjugative transfer system secretin TraK [Legionella pneumophila]HAT1874706.1 type-F conjugative transfer system secretin TraK [Legionella pneumophila]HAT3873749.1 type-F conjugative transfer system secretin TraK